MTETSDRDPRVDRASAIAGDDPPRPSDDVRRRTDELAAALEGLVPRLGRLPLPGSGRTPQRLEELADVGSADLSLARVAEAHADALAIAAEAGHAPVEGARYGVWAARTAEQVVTASREGDGWRLTGRKPWCSGTGVVTHALVTAEAPRGPLLFELAVDDPGVTVVDRPWRATAFGDTGTVTLGLDLHLPDRRRIGGPGWYLADRGSGTAPSGSPPAGRAGCGGWRPGPKPGGVAAHTPTPIAAPSTPARGRSRPCSMRRGATSTGHPATPGSRTGRPCACATSWTSPSRTPSATCDAVAAPHPSPSTRRPTTSRRWSSTSARATPNVTWRPWPGRSRGWRRGGERHGQGAPVATARMAGGAGGGR